MLVELAVDMSLVASSAPDPGTGRLCCRLPRRWSRSPSTVGVVRKLGGEVMLDMALCASSAVARCCRSDRAAQSPPLVEVAPGDPVRGEHRWRAGPRAAAAKLQIPASHSVEDQHSVPTV